MHIRNRMADVVKLRCNVCQEFLKFIIVDRWQEILYKIAEDAIKKDAHYKDKYISVYEKMREIGIENYSIEDMDVTLICAIVTHPRNLINVKIDKETVNRLKALREDRNITQHSSENEEQEELYLRALLSLIDTRTFIRAVDKYETHIDDEIRRNYRQEWVSKVEELKDTIDEERINYIKTVKDIERSIKEICCLEGDAKRKKFSEYWQRYYQLQYKLKTDEHAFDYFSIKASDAGFEEMHFFAATYYFSIRDYESFVQKARLHINSSQKVIEKKIKEVVDSLNKYYARHNELTHEMSGLLEEINDKGFNYHIYEDGIYDDNCKDEMRNWFVFWKTH